MHDWWAVLERGDTTAAWDAFVSRYRRLIFAAIRHYVQDYDDVMDVFAHVCVALREGDLRRLRAYDRQAEQRARFSTWLVTVVHNLTVDWFRSRDGRRRVPAVAEHLTERQRQIFEHVFLDGLSHAEAYELLRTREASELSFAEFLGELGAMYRAVGDGRRGSLLRSLHPAPPTAAPPEGMTAVESAERHAVLERALASLPARDRVVVELFVMQELPAADVARIAGLPNAKAVYNRAYRALAALRGQLERAGITSGGDV
jgi:DNA-directed RNA polymerase specialized sigma24 family protein